MSEKSRQNETLVVGLARGLTHAQAAREAGCSPRTLQRRLKDESFRQAVQDARGAMLTQAVGQLADAACEAASTLRRLLKAKSETIQLAAARAILESGPKLRESVELAERIERLEQRNVEYQSTTHATGKRNGRPDVFQSERR